MLWHPVRGRGKKHRVSGDTAPCEAMVKLAKGVDVLFHECTFPEVFIEYRAKGNVGIHAHTPPTDLGKIAQQAGVKKLVATHFGHLTHQSHDQNSWGASHASGFNGPTLDGRCGARYP